MTQVEIVTLTKPQLAEIVQGAVAEALALFAAEQRQGMRPLSAHQAAKLARKRCATVLAAIEGGHLAASRDGKAWRIKPADLQVWADAGCPND